MGLVVNDYFAVMPIEWRGFGCVGQSVHSPYVQFQGVYTSDANFTIDLQQTLKHAFGNKRYRFVFCETPGYSFINANDFEWRNSYVLNMHQPYPQLETNYALGHKKNLRRAAKHEIKIVAATDPHLFTSLKNQMTQARNIENIPHTTASRMEKVIDLAIKKGMGDYLMAVTSDTKPCAVAFFLMGKKRCVIFSASNPLGRDYKATFALVDSFIAKYAGQPLLLDFAGSSIKGIAEFNQGFGAVATNYKRFEVNTIPSLFRKLV